MPGKTSTVLALCAALAAAHVAAKPSFPAKIPNGSNVKGVAALGHVSASGGGKLNAFGEAFDSAGLVWTTELCQADSDGDGQTNGQELGDPCCAWVAGSNAKVQWSTGVSHPGDATSTSDASLWASVTCGSGSTSTNTTTTTTAPSTSTTTTAPSTSTTTTAPSAAPTPAPTTSGAASSASLAMASAAVATAVAAVFA